MNLDYILMKFAQQQQMFDEKENQIDYTLDPNREPEVLDRSLLETNKNPDNRQKVLQSEDFDFKQGWKDYESPYSIDLSKDKITLLPQPSFFPEVDLDSIKYVVDLSYLKYDDKDSTLWTKEALKSYNDFKKLYTEFFAAYKDCIRMVEEAGNPDKLIEEIKTKKLSDALPLVTELIKGAVKYGAPQSLLNESFAAVGSLLFKSRASIFNYKRFGEQLDIALKKYNNIKRVLAYIDTKFDSQIKSFLNKPLFIEGLQHADKHPEMRDKVVNLILNNHYNLRDRRSYASIDNLLSGLKTLDGFYSDTFKPVYELVNDSKRIMFTDYYNNISKKIEEKIDAIKQDLLNQFTGELYSAVDGIHQEHNDSNSINLDDKNTDLAYSEISKIISPYINVSTITKMVDMGRFGIYLPNEEDDKEQFEKKKKTEKEEIERIFKLCVIFGTYDAINKKNDTYYNNQPKIIKEKLDEIIETSKDKKEIDEKIINLIDYFALNIFKEHLLIKISKADVSNSYSKESNRENKNILSSVVDAQKEFGDFTLNGFFKFIDNNKYLSKLPTKPIKKYIQMLFDKGDYDLCTMFLGDKYITSFYIVAKILANEGKLDPDNLSKVINDSDLSDIQYTIQNLRSILPKLSINEVLDLFADSVKSASNINRDVKNIKEVASSLHNRTNGMPEKTVRALLSHNNTTFINSRDISKKFNDVVVKLLSYGSFAEFKVRFGDIAKKVLNKGLIKRGFFKRAEFILKIFRDNVEINPSHPNFQDIKDVVLQTLADLDAITQFEKFAQYYEKATGVKKDNNLFKLNLNINDKLRFRVLKDLDPKYFKVGVETNCCQSPGGVGEPAMVDSFINPLAAVIVLEYKSPEGWETAAQSYFHYVPGDNGYILDNVETNPKYTRMQPNGDKINFESIYGHWASIMKEKLNAQYIQAGKGYSDIGANDFEGISSKFDPRSFVVSNKYVDWKAGKNIDLTKIKTKNKDLIQSTANTNYEMIEKLAKIFEGMVGIG